LVVYDGDDNKEPQDRATENRDDPAVSSAESMELGEAAGEWEEADCGPSRGVKLE
jgi:hypothetical protein